MELDTLLQSRVCWYSYLTGKGRDWHVGDLFDLLSNELNSGQTNNDKPIERRLPDTPEGQTM
jgi:hypothetical protein